MNRQRLVMPLIIILLNMKVMVIKTKGYQLKNILIKLDHILET